MPATLTTIADALTAYLNAAGVALSQSFTAVRSYPDFDLELKDLTALRVDVVPVGASSGDAATRGTIQFGQAIDIGIRRKLGSSGRDASTGRINNATIDPYVQLVEEIAAYLAMDRLPAAPDAAWVSTQIRQVYSPQHLREWGQFTSVIRVTYDVEVDT
jgi:hypothetical protein